MRKAIYRLALLAVLLQPVACVFAVGTGGWDEDDREHRLRRIERRLDLLEQQQHDAAVESGAS